MRLLIDQYPCLEENSMQKFIWCYNIFITLRKINNDKIAKTNQRLGIFIRIIQRLKRF